MLQSHVRHLEGSQSGPKARFAERRREIEEKGKREAEALPDYGRRRRGGQEGSEGTTGTETPQRHKSRARDVDF